jgi:hypothetical protein
MSDDSQLLQRLEVYLNEQRADVEMMRTILKKFFLRIVTTGSPDGAEQRLQDLKTDTMASLKARPKGPVDQGDERMRTLVADRGQAFFRELEEVLSEARKVASGRGMN